MRVIPIRGNVDTRLGKLGSGEYDAIVLACAGVERLGLDVGEAYVLPIDESLPAPGQAALGIECLADSDVESLITPLKDEQVAQCVRAERAVSAGFGADCSLPIAAFAVPDNGEVYLRALVASRDGGRIVRAESRGANAEALGRLVVDNLKDAGAQQILDSLGE